MKTILAPRRAESGSTLMIAVVALATISFLLISYLNLTAGVNRSVVRSQTWNDALSVAEAGIEEALINLNINGVGGLKTSGTGWEQYQAGVSAYTYRYLTYDWVNRDYRYYLVYVTTNGANSQRPEIVCHGYKYLANSYANPVVAAAGVTVPYDPWVRRSIRVNCVRGSRHPRGMLAQSYIDMNGNNISTDSYDSSNTLYSTSGRYDPTKAKANGDVGTNLTLTNSISVGNANIKGSVATGPGGTVSVGPSGFITGTVSHDMNVDFPVVNAPFTAAPGIQPGTNGYTYQVPPGNTLGGSLSMSGTQSLLITGPGLTKLYLTGELSVTGNAFIELAAGAQLELYVGGANAKIAGKGIISPTAKATDVSYYGLPGNTSLDMSGNGEFTGTVYAPNAAFTASGGGNNLYDLAGAIVVKTIKLNGHFNLHYDEALGRIPAPNGVTITAWNEF
jgi:hypothetical protein